jgi:hypothetical protein
MKPVKERTPVLVDAAAKSAQMLASSRTSAQYTYRLNNQRPQRNQRLNLAFIFESFPCLSAASVSSVATFFAKQSQSPPPSVDFKCLFYKDLRTKNYELRSQKQTQFKPKQTQPRPPLADLVRRSCGGLPAFSASIHHIYTARAV